MLPIWAVSPLYEYLYIKIMQESGISDYEYVCLIGHYNGLNEKKEELKTRGYSEAILKYLKTQKSTNVESLNVRFTTDGIEYPYFNYVITLYFAFKNNGILPFNGCFVEQPAKIIEIFNVLDALLDESKKKAQKEQDRLNKKNVRNRY